MKPAIASIVSLYAAPDRALLAAAARRGVEHVEFGEQAASASPRRASRSAPPRPPGRCRQPIRPPDEGVHSHLVGGGVRTAGAASPSWSASWARQARGTRPVSGASKVSRAGMAARSRRGLSVVSRSARRARGDGTACRASQMRQHAAVAGRDEAVDDGPAGGPAPPARFGSTANR